MPTSLPACHLTNRYRWSDIRATEGWASLQHHSILRSTLTVTPPRKSISRTHPEILPSRLLVDLKQGSFFTFIPRESNERTFFPEWHTGNIYAMLRSGPSSVELPGTMNADRPATYDFFVSGDYEIRLFGDPRDYGEETPTLKISVSVSVEEKRNDIIRQVSHDVVCDFVNGYAFGNALGVGIRSLDSWWAVEDIKLPSNSSTALSLSLRNKLKIAPSQTRIIPILMEQNAPFFGNEITFLLILSEISSNANASKVAVPVTLPLRRISSWSVSTHEAIRASFFFAASHATLFLAKPPIFPSPDGTSVPIVALHGAGVDVISSPFWADAIPRQRHSWVIMPAGRTEWGLDWHGPSAFEAWATVILLLGHSNGGQGVWHLAVHYPDRVRAALPAAGYLNAQAYVPLTHARGERFADPALRRVLESALTPHNNDLFLGNVADSVPILAIHGGNDTNVPTWHSREYVSIVKSWGEGSNISFHEDEGKPHWYPEVFQGAHVQAFLERMLNPKFESTATSNSATQFTQTVVDPSQSGSLHGWAIDVVSIPGRLSRLHVNLRDGETHVRTTNVQTFSLSPVAIGSDRTLVINGVRLPGTSSTGGSQRFSRSENNTWTLENPADTPLSAPPPPGRIQNILNTPAPLTIIVPSELRAYARALSAALRIAHALDVYFKLDAEIVQDTVALDLLSSEGLEDGNLVVLGGAENAFARALLQAPQYTRSTEFSLAADGAWLFRGRPLPIPLASRAGAEEGISILFTHPHPSNTRGAAVFLAGTDARGEGLERALRLLPLRTGVSVPDWVIAGSGMDDQGAGGVLGAGVWNRSWRWSESMSWIS
ncbi:hypothetical protein DFH11DRAFT_1632998 [Phellopilus nigrolimitatus]|nr:hypothetical protein DFH11DRAFT_1632998 [Phellopilus nigrolimitatus]